MALTREEVVRIAELARLEIADADVGRIAAELDAVLHFVAQLERLDLADCAPTVFAPAGVPLRADEPDEARRLTATAAVSGSPDAEDGFFLVPPIVENVAP